MIAQSEVEVSELVLAGLSWFLPAALLVASAVLVTRRRQARRSYLFAAGVALAVAAWQVCAVVLSLRGPAGSPGPFLLVVKLGVLVVVVGVDLAAALLLLRSRSRLEEGAPESVRAPRRFGADVLLLVIAAASCVVAMPLLVMTGE